MLMILVQRVYDRGHKYALGLTQAHFSRSRKTRVKLSSMVQNVFMTKNVDSIWCITLQGIEKIKTSKKRQENHHDSLNQITRAFWLVQWLFFARIWLERTISCQLSFKDYSIHGSLFVRVKIQFTWVQMFNSQFGIIGWTEFLWLESTWSLNLCQSYLHFHWLWSYYSLQVSSSWGD